MSERADYCPVCKHVFTGHSAPERHWVGTWTVEANWCPGETVDLVAKYERFKELIDEAQTIMAGPFASGSWATMCAAFVNTVALED